MPAPNAGIGFFGVRKSCLTERLNPERAPGQRLRGIFRAAVRERPVTQICNSLHNAVKKTVNHLNFIPVRQGRQR